MSKVKTYEDLHAVLASSPNDELVKATRHLLRDVTPSECSWLKRTFKAGERLHDFDGTTYGVISPSGRAMSEGGEEPFFELPRDALSEIEPTVEPVDQSMLVQAAQDAKLLIDAYIQDFGEITLDGIHACDVHGDLTQALAGVSPAPVSQSEGAGDQDNQTPDALPDNDISLQEIGSSDLWQPIETAPKYGEIWFTAWWPEFRGPEECNRPTIWNKRTARFEDVQDQVDEQPTHWMPLPSPPSMEE